jgi:hypothetical protein
VKRRTLLTLIITSSAVGVGRTSTVTAAATRPYFPRADWLWTPIRSGPVLDRSSSAIAKALSGGSHCAALYDFGVTLKQATGPRHRIAFSNVPAWGSSPFGADTCPVPAGTDLAEQPPAAGGDTHYAVADASTGKVYGLWRADFAGSTKTAEWGGVAALGGDGRDTSGSSTASRISRYAAVIRASEIAAGNIPHALFFGSDIVRPTEFRYPAQGTDGRSSAPVTIPLGARVQLDPAVNLAAIPGITPGELAVGRALQKYGAYCGDSGGARMGFLFEYPDGGSRTVYERAGLAWDYFDMAHLPWHRLRVLARWDGA